MTSTSSEETDRQQSDVLVEDEPKRTLTPRQARRAGSAAAALIMVVVAAALVLRFSNEPSVLIVGVYGAGLVVSGTVVELSRRGRTRLGLWLLVGGIVAVAAAELFLGTR